MRRIAYMAAVLALLCGLGLTVPAAAQETRTPLYYQDPDGKPDYSPVPKKTPDGRDYVAVYEEPETPAAAATTSKPAGKGRILYYRNPMGLPDTSKVPKKDSMGMDYIPVYEGEADDGATIKVSPGKLQRTGVRSETVRRHVISRPVRAPGSVQLDERRVLVVSLRS